MAMRSENGFEAVLQRHESEHMRSPGTDAFNQVVDHVKDEQRAHAVVGETLPHLREK